MGYPPEPLEIKTDLNNARRVLGSKHECSTTAHYVGEQLISEVEQLRKKNEELKSELAVMREWLKK
jgi:Myc leucine zipper domain